MSEPKVKFVVCYFNRNLFISYSYFILKFILEIRIVNLLMQSLFDNRQTLKLTPMYFSKPLTCGNIKINFLSLSMQNSLLFRKPLHVHTVS